MNTTIAPWPDFLGQPIHHGDRLQHTYGQGFIAVRLEGHAEEGDAWRAIYDDATVSRLCLQIGDKGQARVVQHADRAERAAPALSPEAILQRAKYHFRPATEDYPDDYDLYEPGTECAGCIDVLIVRADAFPMSGAGGSNG